MNEVSARTWKIVLGLLALSTLLKFYHIAAPALDWQSWNQVSTLATARYIYRDGLSALWVPRVDLFTGLNVDSNKTFAEFPLLHLLMAGVYHLIGGEAEWVGRVWNIGFSLLGGIYLARLAKRDLSSFGVIACVTIYAYSATNLYYHRTLQTDVPFCAFMVVGLFYFVRWLDGRRLRDGVAAGITIALAALFKAYALYMGAAFLYLLLRRKGFKGLRDPHAWLIAGLSLAPITAWITYGLVSFPNREGVARNLVAGADLWGPWALLLNPRYYLQILAVWFYWTLTPFVWLAMATGVVVTVHTAVRNQPITARPIAWPDWLTAWWLGILVYVIIIRHGNYQHDYYQMPDLEPLAVTAALGVEYIWKGLARRAPSLGVRAAQALVLVLAALSLWYSGYSAWGKMRTETDDYSAGRALAAVRTPTEYLIYWDLGRLRHNQMLYYSGGPGFRMTDTHPSWPDIKPYYDLGARYAAVAMNESDWQKRRNPLPGIETLTAEGHLALLQQKVGDVDRYGTVRHWAIYRIAP